MCHKGVNGECNKLHSKGQVSSSSQTVGLLCVPPVQIFTFHIMFDIKAGRWVSDLSCMIHHNGNEVSAHKGCNTALIGSWLPAFQGSLSVPSSRVRGQRGNLKMGLMACPKMSVTNYQSRAKASISVAVRSLVSKMYILCLMSDTEICPFPITVSNWELSRPSSIIIFV